MIYLCDIIRENIQIRIFKPINWPTSAKNFHKNVFHEKKTHSEILFEVFHICNPVYNNDGGLDRMDKYSFVCGEGWWLLMVVYMLYYLWTQQHPHISVCHIKMSIIPPGTVFDQQTLTCNFPEDAFPCEESASLYGQVREASREAELVLIFLLFQVEFGKKTEEYDY